MTDRSELLVRVITVTVFMGFLSYFWSTLFTYSNAIAAVIPGFQVVPYGILGLVIIIFLFIIKDLFR